MTTFPAPDSIANKLITMRKSIGQLESLGPVDGTRLASTPPLGLVAERILTLLNDLAFEINAEAACGSPRTPAAAFRAAAEGGMITARLAARFASLDEPDHVLFQLCLDIDPVEAARVVSDAVIAFEQYIEQVSHWIASRHELAPESDTARM